MATSASLVERHPGVIDLAVKNRAGVGSYVVGAAVSLDAAYAGTTTLETVVRGRTFRSKTLRRNKKNLVEESNRGLTRISFDPVDYASATVPGDSEITFIRISEVDQAGNNLGEGPILVVPTSGYFGSGRSSLLLRGTAPNVSAGLNFLPPADAMIVDLPRFADEVMVYNDESSISLYVALGYGTQEVEVLAGGSLALSQVGMTLLILRGEGGTAAFRMSSVLVNGIQG